MNWRTIIVAGAILSCIVVSSGGQLHSESDFLVQCPAGVKSTCAPRRVGAVVLCRQGEVMGYASISHYCLSCHSTNRPMTFEHPYDARYPVARADFRERSSLHESIVLKAGFLTCKTCHSGADAENHFLAEHSGLSNICAHCHISYGIECPAKLSDPKSVCIPGRADGKVRCVWGEEVVLYESTSEFCVGCHGGRRSMNLFHPTEIKYPHNRSGFTHIADLDPGIKLEDERITCETCHDKMGEGFSLCMHCHPK